MTELTQLPWSTTLAQQKSWALCFGRTLLSAAEPTMVLQEAAAAWSFNLPLTAPQNSPGTGWVWILKLNIHQLPELKHLLHITYCVSCHCPTSCAPSPPEVSMVSAQASLQLLLLYIAQH